MAAVTPLAIDSKKKSWLIGLGWGLGHTIGMLIIGGLFLLFKEILPIDAIAKHSDQLVGILLIVIGTWSVLRTYFRYHQSKKSKPQFHTHQYSTYTITHLHDDAMNSKHADTHKPSKPVKQNVFTALGIGVIHGCSGFNHLLALLPTLALPTMSQSVLYVLAFVVGTVTVMITFAYFMGFIAHRTEIRHQTFLQWFTYAGGAAAIIIGIIWLLGWSI